MLRDTVGMAILIGATLGQACLASGWNCESDSTRSGFPHAKIVNSTKKPRVPAVFIISGKEMGTMLSARYAEIDKTNLVHGVRYEATQNGVTAKLYIKYREGVDEPLATGETVEGRLTLTQDETPRNYPMTCARYLKNN